MMLLRQSLNKRVPQLMRREVRSFGVIDNRNVYMGIEDDFATCLTLHPVTWPNHGPQIELSLASEALGLVRSLDWEIVQGPTKVIKPAKEDGQSESEEEELEAATRGRFRPTQFSHGAV